MGRESRSALGAGHPALSPRAARVRSPGRWRAPGRGPPRPQGRLGGAGSGAGTAVLGAPASALPGAAAFRADKGCGLGRTGSPAAGCCDRRSRALCWGSRRGPGTPRRRRPQPSTPGSAACPAHPALAPGLTPRPPPLPLPSLSELSIRTACLSGLTLQDRSRVNCSPFGWDGSPLGTTRQGPGSVSPPPRPRSGRPSYFIPSSVLLRDSRRSGAVPGPAVCCLAPGVPFPWGRICHKLVPQLLWQEVRRGYPTGSSCPGCCVLARRGFPSGGYGHWGAASPSPLFSCFDTVARVSAGAWSHLAFQAAWPALRSACRAEGRGDEVAHMGRALGNGCLLRLGPARQAHFLGGSTEAQHRRGVRGLFCPGGWPVSEPSSHACSVSGPQWRSGRGPWWHRWGQRTAERALLGLFPGFH